MCGWSLLCVFGLVLVDEFVFVEFILLIVVGGRGNYVSFIDF